MGVVDVVIVVCFVGVIFLFGVGVVGVGAVVGGVFFFVVGVLRWFEKKNRDCCWCLYWSLSPFLLLVLGAF